MKFSYSGLIKQSEIVTALDRKYQQIVDRMRQQALFDISAITICQSCGFRCYHSEFELTTILSCDALSWLQYEDNLADLLNEEWDAWTSFLESMQEMETEIEDSSGQALAVNWSELG